MATSEQLYNPGTATVFKGSGGDVTFTIESTANAALAVSAQFDRGTGAKPGLYRWFARTKAGSAPTIGTQIDIFLAQAQDATDIPGRLGATDTEISGGVDRTRNLGGAIGVITADTTSSSDSIIATGTCFIYARYVSACWLVNTVALSGTASDHYFTIQPLPPQMQAT